MRILMAAHTYRKFIALMSCWYAGQNSQVLLIKSLFMVLFLQVYKILVWATLLLCVSEKSHICSLLGCHEWLWGMGANAVAWDPSYNNTAFFEGPTATAKTTASCVQHQTHNSGPLPCLPTNLAGDLPRAACRQKFFPWHHGTLQGGWSCVKL